MSVLQKAAQVIDVLARSGGPVRLGPLAGEVGLPKSSVHRLLADLVGLSVVRQLDDGSYAAGYRLVEWGRSADRTLDLRATAEPLMRQLCAAAGESVHLHVPQGCYRICVAAVDGPHMLRPVIPVGHASLLGYGAAGKLLLADAAEAVRSEARALAASSGRGPWPDEDQLTRIRREGWAVSAGELESGLSALSAAVPTRGGRVLGALTISGATQRLTARRCAEARPLVMDAAQALARAIGA